MNRFTKESWARILDKETVKDWQIAQIWKSKHFRAAKKRTPSSINSDRHAFSFALKNELKFRTVNGFNPISKLFMDDDLEVVDLDLPTTKFYFDEHERVFRPLVQRYTLTRVMHRYYFNARIKLTLERWNEIKNDLYIPARKSQSEIIPAVLVVGHGDHVYFMLDSTRDQIKIGVSNQLITRYHAIKYSLGSNDITILKVISCGGYELESALHRYFNRHRVRPRGEWFRDHKDIRAFIHQLHIGKSAWDLMKA